MADTQLFRKVMGKFTTGITVVTVTQKNGGVKGMTANSFASVSLDPMQVLVCVDYRAQTLELMRTNDRFGICVLAEHQRPVSEYFTRFDQDPEAARRLDIRFRLSGRGTPFLEDCLATIECRKIGAYPGGDHTIFIGEVESMSAIDGLPLLFYSGRYHRLGGEA